MRKEMFNVYYETLTSPRSGEKYSALDALYKFLLRRNFDGKWKMGETYPPQYEWTIDHDGYVVLDARSLESKWTNSIVSYLHAEIPFHRTGEGKYEFGIYRSENPNDRANKAEYYREPREVRIVSWVDNIEESEEISFNWDIRSDAEEQEKILEILRETIISQAMTSEVKEG
jgi:hypothetical protein